MKHTLLTVEQIAESIQVHKSWIYAHTRKTAPDQIPHLKAGKYLRFYLNDVLDWLEKK